MFKDEKELSVPMEERLLIYPEARQTLFLNMIENFKVFCPDLKLLYAALNYKADIKIEYLIIFKGEKEGKTFIVWDCPFLYTERTIPSYRYAVKNDLYETFFYTCRKHFCQMPENKFNEFVKSALCGNLSFNSNDKNYWKSQDNSESLMEGFSELGLLYRPEGFNGSKKD